MTIEIKVMRQGDEDILRHVAADVFDQPIDHDLLVEFLTDPRHHLVVALDDTMVVAFASAVHYVHPDKRPQLFINEVAVAPTHRRRGVGKAVLVALLKIGEAHRCTVAWVLTDRSNVAAMALYASVGGTEGADSGYSGADLLGYSFALADKRA